MRNFKQQSENSLNQELDGSMNQTKKKTFSIETYGCQMNNSDTEIINSILQSAGFEYTQSLENSDIVLLNTCAIRESAEVKIWMRLQELRAIKRKSNQKLITGVLGCMAERLKERLVEKNKVVDIIVGPDAYRDLPRLINALRPENDWYGMNTQLSLDETYADITPIRINENSRQAFVSIMRGCNNMCSFCIVPFTRGRERSRDIDSILNEVKGLKQQGIKEITLLGQNVNSYYDNQQEQIIQQHNNSEGFKETYKLRGNEKGARFANLLEACAIEAPEIRFRFTSPHPKDFPDYLLEIIKKYPNICKNIHLPAQSGNSEMLQKMRRNHTREAYINLVNQIRDKIYGVTFSTDFICGFCGETEEQFQDSLSLIEYVQYEQAFIFAYSMREKTHAHRRMVDDVPQDVKMSRLKIMNDLFTKNQEISTKKEIGKFHLVLVEGEAKFKGQIKGRTDTNRITIFKEDECNQQLSSQQLDYFQQHAFKHQNDEILKNIKTMNDQYNNYTKTKIIPGDYIITYIKETTKRTLIGEPICKSSIQQFSSLSQSLPFISQKL